MMAAVLLAVAADCIAVNKSESFWKKSQPIVKAERQSMKKSNWMAVVISLLILAAAAFREAYMIFQL
jgi:hypothetical protein